MVTIFSFQGCPYCDKAKRYLDSKGIAYEVHDIELNPEDAEACEKLSGDTMVPVITADDKNFVVGFDKAKIDALLGI